MIFGKYHKQTKLLEATAQTLFQVRPQVLTSFIGLHAITLSCFSILYLHRPLCNLAHFFVFVLQLHRVNRSPETKERINRYHYSFIGPVHNISKCLFVLFHIFYVTGSRFIIGRKKNSHFLKYVCTSD